MPSSTNLYLFTSLYPFDNSSENAFLKNELIYLKDKFEKITVIPRYISDFTSPYPAWLNLDRGLAMSKRNSLTTIDLVKLPWEFIFSEATSMEKNHFFRKVKSMYWSVSYILDVFDWFDRQIQQENIDVQKSLFYTYWLGDTTLALSLIKKNNPGIKIISRAHRIDLYEELRENQFIPGRYITLKMIDKLFLISEHGIEYLRKKYKEFSTRYIVSRLGVENPGSSCMCSKDRIFRIVSCSSITKAKRLDRLAMALEELAKQNSTQLLQWHHFGIGDLNESINLITKDFPANIQVRFFGHVANKEILKYYKEIPVDLFVNVSDSEGIPVSIMEAQSFGIPILATAVGGTPEIVTDKNGWLIPGDATPSFIANAIEIAMHEVGENNSKREASFETWKALYNAEINFARFAEQVSSV